MGWLIAMAMAGVIIRGIPATNLDELGETYLRGMIDGFRRKWRGMKENAENARIRKMELVIEDQ